MLILARLDREESEDISALVDVQPEEEEEESVPGPSGLNRVEDRGLSDLSHELLGRSSYYRFT